MAKIIYLENDEEITDVIDKISKVDEKDVSLVIPRGSTLANSVVNLKLLKKRSKDLGKGVALVTGDKIAKNLSSQIGLKVFDNISDAKAEKISEPVEEIKKPDETVEDNPKDADGVKVNQYKREETPAEKEIEDAAAESAIADAEEAEPVVFDAVRDIDDNEPKRDILPADFEKDDDPVIKHEERLEVKNPSKGYDPRELKKESPRLDPTFERIRGAKKRRNKIIGIIAGAVVVILIAGLFTILPKAKIKISVVAEAFSSSAEIKIDKTASEVSVDSMTIPGAIISKEDELEKTYSATGSKNIGEKASGKITIYNYWDNSSHVIPAGTKFTTSSGIVFSSTAAVTVPAGTVNITPPSTYTINPPGTVDVNVTAETVGAAGNIGASQFTISEVASSQQSKIYGKSSSAMSGGSDKTVKIVSDKDIADAKADLEKELKAKIVESVKAKMQTDEKLLDSATAYTTTSESKSKNSGDQSDTFTYKMKINSENLVFLESNFRSILLSDAGKKLNGDQELVSNDNQVINYEVVSSDVAKGVLNLKGSFNGFVAKKFDIAGLKKDLRLKSIQKATNIITAKEGVLSTDIVVSPRFLRSLPLITNRIDIELNYGDK